MPFLRSPPSRRSLVLSKIRRRSHCFSASRYQRYRQGKLVNLLTDKSGDFQAQDLPPGRYEIQVSKAGFQRKLISDVALGARQHLRIDVDLAVGTAKQEITVDAGNEGAIETETASIASTLDSQSVMNLPANFRASGSTSPLNLVQALPGVQPDTAAGTNSPTANGTPSVSFSVQGGQPFQTETSVDGISTQNVSNNTPLSDAFPSAESIAEMRVEGVNNNAEFGQAGEITTVTKSGANQVHGSAFWYAQNRAFDAVAFGTPIDPATGKAEKPEKIGNDFGGSIGGPSDSPPLQWARQNLLLRHLRRIPFSQADDDQKPCANPTNAARRFQPGSPP